MISPRLVEIDAVLCTSLSKGINDSQLQGVLPYDAKLPSFSALD